MIDHFSASRRANATRKVRYAVVGLGHIAQNAILPEFRRAKRNSKLTALVSSDQDKLTTLGQKYGVNYLYTYDQFDACIRSGNVDAVYIALPNDMHSEYAIRSAAAGIHVLCEKPMAVTSFDCERMMRGATNVRLMIAYRLHFEKANLQAIEDTNGGSIGEPRFFCSTFSRTVVPGDIRLQAERGGGTLYDIGIYCINAARYLFRAEPIEVYACNGRGNDPRFSEVDEMTVAILRFPGDRLASFSCSFGASDVSEYLVVGTEGNVRMQPAYDYRQSLIRIDRRHW